MSTWLPGFPVEDLGGGSMVDGFPSRLVIHTTEGGWDSSMAVFRQHDEPHVLCDPAAERKVQLVPLERSASALVHRGIETNRANCAQIEVVGFAGQTQGYDDDWYAWLATEVVAPILAARAITTEHPTFYGEGCGWVLAAPDARQRFSDAAWRAFHGICGHQHVPSGNVHWDPGAFDIDRLISHLNGGDLTVMDTATQAYLDAHFLAQVIATKKSELALHQLIKRKFAKAGDHDDELDQSIDALGDEIEQLQHQLDETHAA